MEKPSQAVASHTQSLKRINNDDNDGIPPTETNRCQSGLIMGKTNTLIDIIDILL